MEITTLCAVVAALRIRPDRSQFFIHESVTLSCEQQGNSSGWTVKRNSSSGKDVNSSSFWGRINESYCVTADIYPGDTGVYWCESAAGGCSNTVTISVTAGSVILDSPVLPVTEGDAVTLSCRRRSASSSTSTADFYKDGRLIETRSTGNTSIMTIHSVSKADEGLYGCNVSGAGRSPESRLAVRGRPEPLETPLTCILLPVVGACLTLVSLLGVTLLCLWRSRKGKEDSDVPYTDVVTISPTNRTRDVDAAQTFYSTVKPGNT